MKTRTTIYLPPSLKKLIEDSADEKGQTLSMWIERACRAALTPAEEKQAQPV
jgi:hypothetical protein